jgi:acetylornithine deacetylase/succinyl-diaminopimelate desuccinylase-like protein
MSDAETTTLLKDFIAIQSVSADPQRIHFISDAASFIQTELKKLGFTIEINKEGNLPPLIYAEKIHSPQSATLGLYAHYDVQPEDPVHEWTTKPFELTQKDGKFYGRGVADDKGHLIQILTALKQLINENALNKNIVCIFEGEEETGSPHLENYVARIKEKLEKIDVFYIFDTGMYQKNIPQIYYGLRGLIYFELEIQTGIHDVHSGSYGNKILNPALVASHLFSSMKDPKTHRVLIPGFYDDVLEPQENEKNQLLEIARPDEEELKESGFFTITTVGDVHSFLSTKILPSLDINGIESGYTGIGAKTIIPNKATIKFSCRLVEHQDPDKVLNLVKNFINDHLPEGAKHDLKILSKDAPFYTATDNPFTTQTARALEKVFGNKVVFNRSGGSISAAEVFQRLVKKPVILTGFILPDCNLHAPNENYDEDMFWKGIIAMKEIFSTITL